MRKLKKAFTLVELVIVIAVVAILAAVLIPTISSVVENANESVDTQLVTNLNKHLKIHLADNKIEDENDLWDFLNGLYGSDVNETLTPKATKKGNHFWYNTETKIVQYGTLEDIFNPNFERVSNKTFNTSSLRVFNNKYYLLDKDGSDIAKVINNFENLNSANKYIEAIDSILSLPTSIQSGFLAKVENTAIATNQGTFRYQSGATSIYFNTDINTLSSNLYLYNKDTNSVEKTHSSVSNPIFTFDAAAEKVLVLPNSIENVETGSLFFNVDNEVLIYGDFTTFDEVAQIFKASSTNGIIKIPNDQITNNGGSLENSQGTQKPVDHTNKLLGFDFYCTSIQNQLSFDNNQIWISVDKKIFSLSVGNFVLSNGNFASSDEVSVLWESEDQDLLITGTDELSKEFDYTNVSEDKEQFTITATVQSPLYGQITKSVTVNIVTFNDVIATKIDNIESDIDEDNLLITSYYTLNKDKWTITFVSYYNIIDTDLSCGLNIKFKDDLFGTITHTKNNVSGTDDFGEIYYINEFEFNLQNAEIKSGTDSLQVLVGGKLFKTYTINLIDIATIPFDVSSNANVSLYKGSLDVGTANSITLDTLFTRNGSSVVDNDVYITRDVVNSNADFSLDKETITVDNWATTKISFIGSGKLRILIKIGENGNPCSIDLEVRSGFKNVTKPSEWAGGNLCLLNDIVTDTPISVSSSTIYGNYHAVSCTTYTSTAGNNFITLTNGHLKEFILNGPTFDKVVMSGNKDTGKFVHGVLSTDTSTIENCYLYGFRAPIRINSGNLTIKGSIIEGGAYANIIIYKADSLTLDNSKTIQKGSGYKVTVGTELDYIIGLGVFIETNEADGCLITMKNGSVQYNWVTQENGEMMGGTDYISTILSLASKYVFDVSNGSSTIKYINTGILHELEWGTHCYSVFGIGKYYTEKIFSTNNSLINYEQLNSGAIGKDYSFASIKNSSNYNVSNDLSYMNNFNGSTTFLEEVAARYSSNN